MYKLAWLVAAAALVFVTAAGAEQTYPDPEGDAGVGTDILAVKVANDPSGAITFTVTTKLPLSENHAIVAVIDADKSRSTGFQSPFAGFDYQLYAFDNNPAAFAWNGAQYARVSPPSFHASISGMTVQIAINRSDLGNTSGFSFYVASLSFDGPTYSLVRLWDDTRLSTYDLVFPVRLTVAKAGSGGGRVVAEGTTVDCGEVCSADFDSGQSVTLRAIADVGSTFSSWTGADCPPAETTCAITLRADTTVTAVFIQSRLSLTVHKVGAGTVTSKPSGIACGRRCRAFFGAASPVLTARPAAGFVFARWSGACRGSRPSCTIARRNGGVSVTAIFRRR